MTVTFEEHSEPPVRVFGELSPRQKRIEVVRWFLLVPAACLASSAVTLLIGSVVRASTVPLYVLPEFVFVFVGGWIAPRKQLVVALVLMVFGGALSVMRHVVLQHLGGRALGPTNYTHCGLEMAGLLAGLRASG